MSFVDDHRSTSSTIRVTPDNTAEPASPPFPPHTPDDAFSVLSGRSVSLGLRCFCGNSLDSKRKSGMFCSMGMFDTVDDALTDPACARSGTFSSLTTHHRLPSIGNLSEPLVLKDSLAPSATSDFFDESSPHPRAMARADQRREERRRRRADPIDMGVHSPMIFRSSTCPNMTTSTNSPTVVPDLVASHSRNTSTTSSIFSLASGTTLSRNGSLSSSHHRQPSSVAVGAAIMEVDGEDSAEMALARSTLKARARRRNHSTARSNTCSTSSSSSNMRVNDMLDELLSMEQSFSVDTNWEVEVDEHPHTPERIFTPLHRPPRTPSPVNTGNVVVPPAPGAPDRRSSLCESRSSSSFAHQSSLSESHTALYLATASPLQSSQNDSNRRSASPQLSLRRSIVFTPNHAGPALPHSPRRYESPSRRKPLTPTTHHPDMDAWRFPKTEFEDDYDMPEPAGLLWPQGSSRSLSQSAFPTSQARMNLAELATSRTMEPPRSGLRLNMLLSRRRQ